MVRGYLNKHGKYIRGDITPSTPEQNAQEREYNRLAMREEYAKDLVQPFVSGQVNPEFIEAFPEAAKRYGMIKEPQDD